MSNMRPLFDCFVERSGETYLCEVYDAFDGYVESFVVCPLNEDGSKGEYIIEDGFEDEVQKRYWAWINEPIGDEVI